VAVFAELKRRNVFRVGALYLVAAWVLLQIGDLLFGLLGLPAWSNKLLFAGLVLGFVPALIFSWVYELTSEGLKREHEVERNASITAETARKLDLIVVGLLVVAIVVVVIERFIPRTAPIPAATDAASEVSSAEAPVLTAAKSIAVLPFADMSAGKDQEYFADGLSEELLNLLAKLPELRVIGRTSSFQFKGRNEDLRVIGEKLNVAHILEGSVRKSGEKVRITAQLIRANDGSHLWSETYDRTLDDIFVVQEDIAGEVVKALELTLLGPTSVTRSRPVDPDAYNLALQGRFFLDRRGREDLERAVEYFRRSRERDPGYAPAWAGLSEAYAGQANFGHMPVAEGYRRAREAAEKALALDPQLVDAYLALSSIQQGYDWDWEAADASLRKALDLEPGSAQALGRVGSLAQTLGRWNEAIDLADKAIERDPLRANSYNSLGSALLAVNRDTEAEAAYRSALELDPGGGFRHYALGRALLLQGKADAALREMQQETEEAYRLAGLPLAFHALGRRGESDAALAALKSQHAGEMAYQIAQIHAVRGEADLAFEWLERAYDQRDNGVTWIKSDRLMRGLVGDPRYKAFLRKLKLPE
jgi:TolB-like protein/Tfp pilus assembly protein PilF